MKVHMSKDELIEALRLAYMYDIITEESYDRATALIKPAEILMNIHIHYLMKRIIL